jgi:hypothetical protein
MIPQSADTSPRIEQVLISLIRQSTIPKRLARMRSMSQSVIDLSRRAIMRANKNASEAELSILFVRHFYGESIAQSFRYFLERSSK